MNEEEIIKIAEDFVNYIRFKEKPKYSESQWFMAIEDLLDMYRQEKEKKKKLEEEVKCFRDSYKEARIEECDTYFLMNKVIDMMAEKILNLDIKMSKDRYDHARVWDTKEGIKEYYFNKVKEKKDATKNIG